MADWLGPYFKGRGNSSPTIADVRVIKVTFAKDAKVGNPSGLFNSSLEGNTRHAIDFYEGDKIDKKALKVLVRAAATLNKA